MKKERCVQCGQTIDGPAFELKRGTLCAWCFKEMPCEPASDADQSSEVPDMDSCGFEASKQRVCVCCGLAITGYWLNVRRGKVCAPCAYGLGWRHRKEQWDGHHGQEA